MERPATRPPRCVIVPVYNHACTVGAVVRGALEPRSTVLACDDGSTDGSGEEARIGRCHRAPHERNQGKGAALRTLLDEATQRGSGTPWHRRGWPAPSVGIFPVWPAPLPPRRAPSSSNEGPHLRRGSRVGEFGRRFSNFWVWFECGARVDDSQSGSRRTLFRRRTRLRTLPAQDDFGGGDPPARSLGRPAASPGSPSRSSIPKTASRTFVPSGTTRDLPSQHPHLSASLVPSPWGPGCAPCPMHRASRLLALRRGVAGGSGPAWRRGPRWPEPCPSWSVAPSGEGCSGSDQRRVGLGALPAGLRRWRAHRTGWGRGDLVVGAGLLGLLEDRCGVDRRPRRLDRQEPRGVVGHGSSSGDEAVRRGCRIWRVYPVALYFMFTRARPGAPPRSSWSGCWGPLQVSSASPDLSALPDLPADAGWTRRCCPRAARSLCASRAGHRAHPGGSSRGEGRHPAHAHLALDVAAGLLGDDATRVAIVALPGEHERLARYLERAHGPSRTSLPWGMSCSPPGDGEGLEGGDDGSPSRETRPVRRVVAPTFFRHEASFPVGPFMWPPSAVRR